MSINISLLVVSLLLFPAFALGWQNNTNVTNSTDETAKIVSYHNWDLWIRNSYNAARNFSYDGYVLANGKYFSGYADIISHFNSTFAKEYSYNCQAFQITNTFYLNETAHIDWIQSCSGYTVYGGNTYRVENRSIKQFITNFVWVSTQNSSSNCSNSSSGASTEVSWEVASRQFLAWGRSDLQAILADYAYDAFVIRQGNQSRTDIIQGYNNIYWFFQQTLYEIQNCPSAYWQTPVVNKNVIHLSWIQECYGQRSSGEHTLIVNAFGKISSLVSSNKSWRRHLRSAFVQKV